MKIPFSASWSISEEFIRRKAAEQYGHFITSHYHMVPSLPTTRYCFRLSLQNYGVDIALSMTNLWDTLDSNLKISIPSNGFLTIAKDFFGIDRGEGVAICKKEDLLDLKQNFLVHGCLTFNFEGEFTYYRPKTPEVKVCSIFISLIQSENL